MSQIRQRIGMIFGTTQKTQETVTKEEVQEMIDAAIRKHNRNAGMISMFVGFFILGLFSEGLLRLIGVLPPLLPWLKITL